jgi:hypothetical protein
MAEINEVEIKETETNNDPWENATPKTYLFGLIRGLKEEIEEIEDESLRGYLLGYIERIETWEPGITDYDWY